MCSGICRGVSVVSRNPSWERERAKFNFTCYIHVEWWAIVHTMPFRVRAWLVHFCATKKCFSWPVVKGANHEYNYWNISHTRNPLWKFLHTPLICTVQQEYKLWKWTMHVYTASHRTQLATDTVLSASPVAHTVQVYRSIFERVEGCRDGSVKNHWTWEGMWWLKRRIVVKLVDCSRGKLGVMCFVITPEGHVRGTGLLHNLLQPAFHWEAQQVCLGEELSPGKEKVGRHTLEALK